MKIRFQSYARSLALGALFLAFVGAVPLTHAGEARLTRVLQEATVSGAGGGLHPARPNEVLTAGALVRTGVSGRAEITSPAGVVTRVGDKTRLALAPQEGGIMNLQDGLVLFQAPRGASGAKIETGEITVEFKGSTGLLERNSTAYVKVLGLEGETRVFTRQLGESILLAPGQLLITNPQAKRLPEPVNFSIEQLYKTSLLLNSGFAPLPSRVEIERAIAEQKSDASYIPTNLVIFGRGTLVNLMPSRSVPTSTPKSKR